MRTTAVALFLILGLFFIGVSFNDSNAELNPNQAYLVEGSGYAVTEKSIKISQIDFLTLTGNQLGSSTALSIEDGFITMDEIDFVATDISGNVLRDGRFIRIAGTAESSIGTEVSISLFGRLIESTNEGSIYSFTGRLNQGSDSNKIIYTTKISTLGGTLPTTSPTTTTSQTKENEILIHIAEGAAKPTDFNYLAQGYLQQKKFLSPDRISTIPGTTLTFINDDTVSHSISSGIRDTSSKAGIATADGKITSGEILPGKRWSITINDIGFLFLFDEKYPWMTMDVVVFPDIDSDVIKRGQTKPVN